ncbi:MAG: acyl CoA:acetate/3-ketoacid CoA transferase [Cellvibrionaceae bacterium]|nr:acyl CoA:acetate/3-ketoacid CoA transferase [Cellvibrionaceae bacterium]
MKNKLVSADNSVALIQDGDTLCLSGFVGTGTPEDLIIALEKRFLATGSPRDLTLVFAAAPGDGGTRGANRLAHKGLLKRVIGGHWALVPEIAKLAINNEIEAYNFPMGTITQLFRDISAHRGGILTQVGLGTFVDPRKQGGKLNEITTENLVELLILDGQEWLFYKTFPINVAFLRGTTSDPRGNTTLEKEALTLDNLAIAMATKNSNGLVIVQTERIAEDKTLDPRRVKIPRIMVDCVVVADPDNHHQTYGTPYSPAFANEIRSQLDDIQPLEMSERKIIARRCAYELPMGGVVNLGIGMPEGIAAVANEEKVLDFITMTAEPGVIGGFPQSGLNFGCSINMDALLDQNQQFDFYDGGGLDLAALGLAQVDQKGNVNVSKFGPKIAGAGGFINISQNARKLVFAGSFTAGGLKIRLDNGKLTILQEGKFRKFVNKVEQITFNGRLAATKEKPVYYVTERCVFKLRYYGLELLEVAPGIDIDRDILAHMDFKPIIKEPRLMASNIFFDDPMQLSEILLERELSERISYDSERNTAFLNLEGNQIRSKDDVNRIFHVVEDLYHSVGRHFAMVVNYDGAYIDPLIMDYHAESIAKMEDEFYTSCTRYSTGAFLRMKLGKALERRKVAPHLFESDKQARKALQRYLEELTIAADVDNLPLPTDKQAATEKIVPISSLK